jgi:hypothetical protein
MINNFQSSTPNILILAMTTLLALLSLPSCQKCELLEQVVTDPPPIPVVCEGTFYINKAEPGIDLVFSLHEFAKPVPEPFASVSKAGPFGVPAMLFNVRSNFSAYDSLSRRYVYQHYYGTGAHFFSFDVGSGVSNNAALPGGIDVCPVFHKGRLYSIFTEQLSATDWLYNIVDIDPVTGQANFVIGGDDIAVNSPLSAEAMSSVSTGGDLFYFLSVTNLIEVNLSANTTRHIDIDPSYHPIDNIVQYFGLEYKRDEGLLIAMRNKTNSQGAPVTELVSIKVSGASAVVTPLFDISARMQNSPERFVNSEFYSSAFDPCDNTYYVTSLESGMTLNTNFIEVSLPKSEMKLGVLEGYWYGMEYSSR